MLEGDEAARAAGIKVALAELLKSGVTTLVDLSVSCDGWLDALAERGIRACIAPLYRDARWYTENGRGAGPCARDRASAGLGRPADRAPRPALLPDRD